MDLIIQILGKNGVILSVGILIFFLAFKYSVKIFDWMERKNLETKNYIVEKCEFLFIKISHADHVTYAILICLFIPGFLLLITMGFFGLWFLGVVLFCIMVFVGYKAPRQIIDFLVEKRIKKYQSQMVDGLTLLANGLRAGLSVPQSLGMVVNEMPKPLSDEFNVILQQNKIGVPLEECFEMLAKRIPTEDNDMFVTSVNILRETGGNLPEVFDTIVEVIRERIRVQQKIDTFVAQGMFQGYTIAAMPFFLGGVFFASDPSLLNKTFTHPLGIILVGLSVALDFVGLWVIKKVVQIKV